MPNSIRWVRMSNSTMEGKYAEFLNHDISQILDYYYSILLTYPNLTKLLGSTSQI